MTDDDSALLSRTFGAKKALEYAALIGEQLESVYRARGMSFPPIASSALFFISSNEGASLAEIARALGHPHQLVAQRTSKLEALGLVQRARSPTDRRRKTFHLTDRGRLEAQRFARYCEEAAEVFRELYDEIGFDLGQVLEDATEALKDRSLVRRFPYPQE